MMKYVKDRSKKIGLPPGTPVHIGDKKVAETHISLLNYSQTNVHEIEIKNIEDCTQFLDEATVTWIDVDGIHQTDIIQQLGEEFQLHPLIMEDIMSSTQRTKLDDFGHYLFIVLKMFYSNGLEESLREEQVSLVIGSNFLISFQESEEDVFRSVRNRIRHQQGRITKKGTDFLAYSLLDSVVDQYFTVLERFDERMATLEQGILDDPTREAYENINIMKREVLFLRKSIWPLREVINCMIRNDTGLIKKQSILYLKDVYDHTIQILDTIETFRDMLSGMLDMYLSSVSYRMNEIMKVMTLIATIFIPLTFITGLYGMNFRYMPELEWHNGYFMSLALMVVIAVAMIIYFKRKNWL